MDLAGKNNASRYNGFPAHRSPSLTTGLQLALSGRIIIIRLLQVIVGNEISS